MRQTRAIAVAFACCGGFAAADQPAAESEAWRVSVGYAEQPTCSLYAPAVGGRDDGFVPVYYWTAEDGWALWFLTQHLDGNPAVRFEFAGSGDAWDVALDPQRADFAGRRALFEPARAASILRNFELGHSLDISIRYENAAAQKYRVPAGGAHIAVPMYRACVQSLVDDPPTYLFEPSVVFMANAAVDGHCEFRQYIQAGYFPVTVSVRAQADGGEVEIERAMESQNPHGPYRKRTGPDHVDAKELFGQRFDLVDKFRYEIPLAQLNALAGELLRGKSRTLRFTNTSGKERALEFGGRWGKPVAAMFAACRSARFPKGQ